MNISNFNSFQIHVVDHILWRDSAISSKLQSTAMSVQDGTQLMSSNAWIQKLKKVTNNIFCLIKCRTEYSYIESHGQSTIEPFSFLLLSNSLENWQINVFFDVLRLCLLLWTACNNCIEIMLQLLVLRKQKLYCDISKICNRLFVESAVIYCKRCWYLIAEITAIRLQNLKI